MVSDMNTRMGINVKLRVSDSLATAARLDPNRTSPLAYKSEAHAYFRAPGGTVFRLAPLDNG